MRRVFLIDYENVDVSGLDGVSKLSAEDRVYIYYSKKHNRLTFGLHRRLNESLAEIYYRKIKGHEKNALDNVLLTELQELTGGDSDASYIIISEDQDYDSTIKELKRNGIKVERKLKIAEDNQFQKDKIRKKLEERLIGDAKFALSEEDIGEIIEILLSSGDKTKINNSLQKIFYNSDVKYILTRIKDLI
ncbi:MAG: PIN domain-containing protein [Bacteroidales bacterium]|nr:PIN domain-containing protein [Clostridium sp.]MCM1204652.1 PIN domain-containing protein [Bacteroidales bacterium]